MIGIDNIFYVYAYLDTRKPGNFIYDDLHFDYEPFYVGKGSGKRCYQHIKQAQSENKKYDEHIHRKIRKIFDESGNLPVVIKLKENIIVENALQLETDIISKIGREDLGKGPLINKTDGGEGVKNISETTRKNFSEAAKIRMRDKNIRKKIYTKERHDKISKSLRGKKKTFQHVAKLPQNQKGYKHSQEFKDKIRDWNEKYGDTISRKCVYDWWVSKYGKEIADNKMVEYRKSLSAKSTGKNNPMYGKSVEEVWIEKFGEAIAHSMWEELNKKRSASTKGKKKSEDCKKKMSLAAKKRWQKERENKLNNPQI